MDWGLVLTFCAVIVAGVAAVVGLWMERDPRRPPRWAWSLSSLIILATVTTVATSYSDSKEDARREVDAITRYDDLKARSALLQKGSDRLEKEAKDSKKREEDMQDDLARMLVKLDKLAGESEDPALKELVSTEIGAQSRKNEDVVGKVAQRVKDGGGNPDTVLAAHLPPEELQRVTRSLKAKEEPMSALLEKKGKKGKKDKKDKKGKKKKDGDAAEGSEDGEAEEAASEGDMAEAGAGDAGPAAVDESKKKKSGAKKKKKDKAAATPTSAPEAPAPATP